MKKDWNHLSQREKAEYIRLGIKNGLDLQGTKQLYEYYQDQKNNQDYDMSAYLEDNKEQAFSHINGQHYPDTYKKPNHPTFSDESIYSTKETPGGHWGYQNGKEVFYPSEWQIETFGNNYILDGMKQQGDSDVIPVRMGGVMLPEITVTSQYKDDGESSLLGTIRHRLATNINPFNYANPISRVFNAVVRNKKEDTRQKLDNWVAEGLPGGQERKYRLAAWSKYLGSPIEGINNDNYIIKSQYTPRFSKNADTVYYTYKPTEGHDIFDAFQINSGNFTIGYGQDQKGTYYSLYDIWDINPFGGANSGDASLGIGNPFEVYDRIYYQDSPDAYNKAQTFYRQMLEEQGKQEGDNVVVKYKDGGSIHIAPSKKGTFTELKERTGKSSTWYKEYGTPEQRKMATFALNARKWSHKHEGTTSDSRLYIEKKSKSYPTTSLQSFIGGLEDYILRRKIPKSFIKSPYRPTKGDNGEEYYTREGLKNEVLLNILGGTDSNKKHFGLPYFYKDFNSAYEDASIHNISRVASNGTLGNYVVSAGKDTRGRYLSFNDIFDFVFIPGKPIHIYDRIYEDEVPKLYNPNTSALSGYDIFTASPLWKDIKAQGGYLQNQLSKPFSYQPIPEVRYKKGGFLKNTIDWLSSLFGLNQDETQQSEGIDLREIAARQAYAESGFDSNAKSNAGAMGLFQIMPSVLQDYNTKNNNTIPTDSLINDSINTNVRNWYMNDLMNRGWNTKNNPSDSVRVAKALGAYNWGSGNLVNALNKAKADGVDIYNSWDWLPYLAPETRDYIDFILMGNNNSLHRNNIAYKTKSKQNQEKVDNIKNSFAKGGNLNSKNISNKNREIAKIKSQLEQLAINNNFSAEELKELRKFDEKSEVYKRAVELYKKYKYDF